MIASIKSLWKWSPSKKDDSISIKSSSLFLMIFLNILEDVLFWKKVWLSSLFFVFFNVVFITCVYREINLLPCILYGSIVMLFLDAFEMWLKYKHRTTCLKRLVSHDNSNLKLVLMKTKSWLERKLMGYLYLRDKNHTKAFILLQIPLGCLFFITRYISGYTLLYLFCTVLFFLNKIIPPLINIINKVRQNAESEFELEGLVPDENETNLALLSIEPEQKPVFDERQSLDYWKPEDLPLEEEASDSSDNSSSLVTNLSIEKIQTLTKDVEITDSSEDEYMPQEQTEHFQSTLEVQPSGSWGGAAFNVFSNLGGAVANMVYKKQDDLKRKRVSSIDSSDGFEMIDTNELQ